MIDWKDVNKELPKEDCNVRVLLRIYDFWGRFVDNEIEEDVEYFRYDKLFQYLYGYTYHHSKKSKFKQVIINHKTRTNRRCVLTHWAYINKPAELKKGKVE